MRTMTKYKTPARLPRTEKRGCSAAKRPQRRMQRRSAWRMLRLRFPQSHRACLSVRRADGLAMLTSDSSPHPCATPMQVVAML